MAPQAHGINQSILTTGTWSLADMSSQLSELGSLDDYTPSHPMAGSVAQPMSNNPFQIHHPLQFSPTSESIDTSVPFQHSDTSSGHSQFGIMSNVRDSNAFGFNTGSKWSYDHSMFLDANTTISPYSLSSPLSNTGSFLNSYNGNDSFVSFQTFPSPSLTSASQCSMDLPASQQSPLMQQQIANGASSSGAPSRPLFGPLRTIKTLPPQKRGGRRGPLSASQLDQRHRAKKKGICFRCRKLKEKASDLISAGVSFDNSDPAFLVLWRHSLCCVPGEFKSDFVGPSLRKGSI
jgi:hypothetical protein